MPRLDARRVDRELDRPATGTPPDGRPRDLDVRDDPFLLRLAPEREDHGAAAQHGIVAPAAEHILEFDILQQRPGLGHVVADHFMAAADAGLHDHFVGPGSGERRRSLGFGDRQRYLALLARRHFLGLKDRLVFRGQDVIDDQDGLFAFLETVPGRRASREQQEAGDQEQRKGEAPDLNH